MSEHDPDDVIRRYLELLSGCEPDVEPRFVSLPFADVYRILHVLSELRTVLDQPIVARDGVPISSLIPAELLEEVDNLLALIAARAGEHS